MTRANGTGGSRQELLAELADLRARLQEAEDTLRAIHEGEVDAIVVSGGRGEQVFSIAGAEHVYRLIVETMSEAALTATPDGRVLFCNQQFSELLGVPAERIIGRDLARFASPEHQPAAMSLIARGRDATVRQRLVLLNAEGRPVPVHVAANPLHGPDGLSLCVVATDLRELEAAASKLRRRTEDLARTVDSLQEEVVRRNQVERALQELNAALTRRTEQLRALASELTLAEQRERYRLAHILHDHLQQLLVGARLRTAVLERTGAPDTRGAIVELGNLLDEAIESSRSLTAELSPPILHEGGLVPALGWLVRRTQEKHGLAVELAADDGANPGREDVTILLFQAVRELLFNVVKHAGVKSARVEVAKQDEHIRVTVSDEGAGFDPSAAPTGGAGGGFGLFSIRERLELLGGRMDVDSAPGRGSRLTLLAPLGAQAGR